jgi:hypothetical protein
MNHSVTPLARALGRALDVAHQPIPTLTPGQLFTVQQYEYTTFEFGTDNAYRAEHGDPAGDPGIPWAFPHPAVLSATPIQRPVITGPHLSFGDLVNVPDYGTYRILRDHNRNVKFEAQP